MSLKNKENPLGLDLTKVEEERKAKQLPEPTGYRILCAVPEIEDKTDGGVYLPEQEVEKLGLLTVVLFVLKVGPDCYSDKRRFPNGPWCKEGDFVLVRPHVGSRVKIHGQEFRLINDDCVEAIVEDPRGIRRA